MNTITNSFRTAFRKVSDYFLRTFLIWYFIVAFIVMGNFIGLCLSV